MPSNIDPNYPEQGSATVVSVRNNFGHAQSEITALQNSGGGAGVLCSAPTGGPVASGGTGPMGPHPDGTIWIDQTLLVVYVWFGGGASAPTTGQGPPNNWRRML